MTTGRGRIDEIPVLGDGRFQIVERIGAGGMGTVYRAIQTSVGRPVAIKVLSPEHASNTTGVARFVREANVVSRLVHPNIVSVIDFGRDKQGNLLMVMEYLEGEPLRQLLRRRGRLSVPRAAGVASQVLAALRVAHGAGIVHRDLKPENIFVCRVDGQDHVKVLDFGIAKLVDTEQGDMTTAGSLVGTLRYMAPEQVAGDPPDARVDLYALGVVLYEMLAGTLPFETKDKLQLLRAILNEPAVPLSVRAPEVPPALSDAVMRALHKLPIDRYANADEFRAALTPFVRVGAASADEPPPEPAPSSSPEQGTRAERGGAARPAAEDPHAPLALVASAAAQRGELTTGAGLSAPSHRLHDPTRRSGRAALALGAVGLLALSSAAGLLIARSRAHDAATNAAAPPRPAPLAAAAPAPVVLAPGAAVAPTVPAAAASAVMLQTNPSGAEVHDAVTGMLLCATTPCAVNVVAGQPRRVTLRQGELGVETTLEAGLSPLVLDLRALGHGAEPPAAPESDGAPHANHHRHGGGSGGGGSQGVRMFQAPPGGIAAPGH